MKHDGELRSSPEASSDDESAESNNEVFSLADEIAMTNLTMPSSDSESDDYSDDEESEFHSPTCALE